MKTSRQPKPIKCRECRAPFVPIRSLQPTCGKFDCQVAYASRIADRSAAKRKATDRVQAKADRKLHMERKQALKTRRDWMKEAQVAFNAFIRARDQGKPCICCGLPLVAGDVGGKFDCGHYRSVGSAPHLRFTEANAAGQRKQCNRWGAGRAVDYRLGLIARIGIEAVEALESDQAPRKWTIPELMQIKAEYRAKLNAKV